MYGIQARGLFDEKEPLIDISTMAKEYNQLITELNLQGPYYILGWSMEDISLLKWLSKQHQLIIVDTPATTEKTIFEFVFLPFISQMSKSLFKFTNPALIGQNHFEHFTHLLQKHNFFTTFLLKIYFKIKYHNKIINLKELPQYFQLMKQDFITRGPSFLPLDDILQHLKNKNLLVPEFDDTILKRFYEVLRANVYAICNYTLKHYDENITFFRSKTKFKNLPNHSLGWQQYCSNINIINIPCDHFSIFNNDIALQTLKTSLQEIIGNTDK